MCLIKKCVSCGVEGRKHFDDGGVLCVSCEENDRNIREEITLEVECLDAEKDSDHDCLLDYGSQSARKCDE